MTSTGLGLSLRGRMTYLAHLYKAIARQDHRELEGVLRELVPSDGVVLDVGGHSGQFAKLFARIANQGEVHTFEPGSYARSILTRMCSVTGLSHVHIHPLALGDSETTLTLNIPVKPSGSVKFGLSHISEQSGEDTGRDFAYREEQVDQTTIDHFVERQGLARVDFIKADIEGWEAHMLAGGAETLRRYKPALLLELNPPHLARAGSSVAAIWALLEDAGYAGWAYDAEQGCLAPAVSGAEGDIFFRVQPSQ